MTSLVVVNTNFTTPPLPDDPVVVRQALYKAIGIVAAAALFFAMLWSIYSCTKRRCAPAPTGDKDIEAGGIITTKVGFFHLYRFASATDRFLLASGLVCSSAVGLVWPAFYVLMGSVLDAFVSTHNN